MPSDKQLESELMQTTPPPLPRPRYAIAKSESFKKARQISMKPELPEKGKAFRWIWNLLFEVIETEQKEDDVGLIRRGSVRIKRAFSQKKTVHLQQPVTKWCRLKNMFKMSKHVSTVQNGQVKHLTTYQTVE